MCQPGLRNVSKKLLDIIAKKEKARIASHMPAKNAPVLDEQEQSDLDAFVEAFDAAWIATRDESREVESDGFHPSSLGIAHGKCARRNVYMLRGERKEARFSARILRVFANGHGVHDRLQRVLESMDTGMESEISIDSDNPPIRGHADGTLTWRGKRICVEIKSCSPDVFTNRLKWKKPKDEHFEQVNIYAYVLDIDTIWIVYENKGTQELKFFEKKTDRVAAKKIVDDWHSQWLCHEAGELPKRPYKIGSPVCAGCDFNYMCVSDPEIGVDLKKYKEEVRKLNVD